MSIASLHLRPHQRGMALIASLLLLLVITILGVAMFRSYGLQQHIAGGTRDKSLAFEAAMNAQRYAEFWTQSGNGANATSGSSCSGTAIAIQVCSNLIQSDVQDVPWPSYASYAPSNSGSLYQSPMLYISFLAQKVAAGEIINYYQVDAAGWGANPGSVAVVESTYMVTNNKTSEPVSGQSQITKNINLGGP